MIPYCYLFLLSVFILQFIYYVNDIFCDEFSMGRVNMKNIFLILTVPRRYFCCDSLLLLVVAVRIYTSVHLLCE